MALSTTQYGYIIDPMVPFTDGKGKTIKNGFVRVFVAGSSTPVVTYRNFDGAANQDLIELDNSGRTKISVIGSKGLTYKVCVYDQLHSQESPILTVDKVSVIGANITAGSGATVVTGLDGLKTKPDGFVDASVVGTDGYVALDHTLVEDNLDTDAKATTVENDRYIPLLNEDVNDPDSKMTLGRLWQWVLGKIKSLSTTITTFRTGDVIPVDGPSGTAKMSKDDLLKETAENAVGSIHSISTTATEADLVSGNYLALDGSAGTKKAAADLFAVKSTQESIVGNLMLSKTDTAITKYVGKVVDQYGQLIDIAYHCYTDPVQLDPGCSVTIKCLAQTSVAVIAVLNANNTYTVKVLGRGGSDYIYYSYKNNGTESQNVVFSFKLDKSPSSVIVSSCDVPSYEYVDGKDKMLTDKVQDITDFEELSTSSEGITKNSGKFVNQYGQLTDDAYHYYTDPITLQPGQSISFEARGTNGLVSVISLYSSGTYKPQVVSVDSNYKNYGWKNDSSSSVQVVLSFKLDKAPSVVRVTSSQAVSMIGIVNITNTSKFASMDDLPYGCCNVTNSAALSNKPTSGDYTCVTFGNKERTNCVQLAYGLNDGFEMKRKKYSGTWYPWERVLDEKDKLNFESIISTTCGVSFAEKSYTENTGKYVQFDGQLVTLAFFSYSDDIVLKPNETIVLLGAGASTNVAMISVHDLYYTCVARSVDNALRYYHYTNESGKDQNIAISFNNRYKPSKVMVFSQPDVETIRPSISLFDDIGCLGDSFTDGLLIDSNNVNLGSFNHKYSWPSVMKKHFGITHVENYGVSGATTRSSKTNANQLPKILSDSPRQLYLLCLGINDCWQMPAEYLGSESDINTSDYTQSADTYYGNYYYIIEAIKEHAPDAIIILMLPHYFSPEVRNDFLVASKRIAEIAEVPCIETYKIMKYPTYTNLIGSHPTITGYALMAEYYAKLIEEWMVDKNLLNLVGAE